MFWNMHGVLTVNHFVMLPVADIPACRAVTVPYVVECPTLPKVNLYESVRLFQPTQAALQRESP